MRKNNDHKEPIGNLDPDSQKQIRSEDLKAQTPSTDDSSKFLQSELQQISTQTRAYFACHLPKQKAHGKTKIPLLICLHGYGRYAAEFLEYGKIVAGNEMAVLAPQALNQIYTAPGVVGFSWQTRWKTVDMIENNIRWLKACVKEFGKTSARQNLPLDNKNIFIMGHSQSVSLCYSMILRTKNFLRGMIGIGTGGFPDYNCDLLPKGKKIPILLLHGENDKMTRLSRAESDVDLLKNHKYPVQLKTYSHGHSIRENQLLDARGWIIGQMQPGKTIK